MIYSYLIIGLGATAAGLVAAYLLRTVRFFVIGAGLLAAPAGLADVMFVPEYWHPVHLFGAWFSVEGVLFSFGNGCLIAALACVVYPGLAPARPQNLLHPWFRVLLFMVPGFAVFLVFWRHGLGSLMIMHAAFVGFLAMFVLLALRRWLSLPVALTCGIGFAALYFAQTLIWHWLDPEVARYWVANQYLYVLEVPPFLPIEEFFWAFLYGALWSSLMLFAFRVDLRNRMGIKQI